jgi:hypothetical protein
MTTLSQRTVEQLLASGRGRGFYSGAFQLGVGYETGSEQIPGIADKPRSSGMAPVGDDLPGVWVTWGKGWFTYCRGESEARYLVQRSRRLAREGIPREPNPPAGEGPESGVPHVGVEIECCVPVAERGRLYRLLSAIRGVGVVSDGSIRAPDGHAAVEVRICRVEGEPIRRAVSLVCAALRVCRAVVNTSCGLHVHIDARPEAGRSGGDVWSRLMLSQRLLMAMQPATRRENKFCKRARGKDWEYASGRRRGGRAQRYRAINALSYGEHKTIEVRCHTGTIRAHKINAWVELLVQIARGTLEAAGIKPTMKSLRGLKLSEPSLAYVLARLELYGPRVWGKLATRGRPRSLWTGLVAFPPREEDQPEYEGSLAAA